ncbi:MAG: hypothetical protein AB1791_07990 [Chloroflexota bacterium]
MNNLIVHCSLFRLYNGDMTTTTVRPASEVPLEIAPDEVMAQLEKAAAASDPYDVSAFVTAVKAVDWDSRPAADFVRAVYLALNAGAHLTARHLAMAGAARFPDHAELQKMAYILAPPKATVSKSGPHPENKGNMAWLKENWDTYRGRWVALRGGQLLAVADSLDGLVAQVGEIRNTSILVTSIW